MYDRLFKGRLHGNGTVQKGPVRARQIGEGTIHTMMWRALVCDNGAMSPELMRRIWNEAEHADDEETLGKLAGRSDLPPDIEQQVKKYRRAGVRAARLARRDLSREELLEAIENERAGSALCILATSTIDESTQRALFDRYNQKNVRALLEALAMNPTLEATIAAEVYTELSTRFATPRYLPRRVYDVVDRQLRGRPDVQRAFAKTFQGPTWSSYVMHSTSIDEEGVRHVLARSRGLRSTKDQAQVLQGLAQNIHAVKAASELIRDAVMDHEATTTGVNSSVYQEMLRRIDHNGAANMQVLQDETFQSRLSSSHDVQWLREACTQVLAKRTAQHLHHLLNNPHLPDDCVGLVCAASGLWDDASRRTARALAVRNAEAFLPVVWRSPEILRDSALSVGRLREIARCAVLHMREHGEPAGCKRDRLWHYVLAVAELEEAELLSLPWNAVTFADEETRSRIAGWVSNALGDDAVSWDVLEGLDVGHLAVRESIEAVLSLSGRDA